MFGLTMAITTKVAVTMFLKGAGAAITLLCTGSALRKRKLIPSVKLCGRKCNHEKVKKCIISGAFLRGDWLYNAENGGNGFGGNA